MISLIEYIKPKNYDQLVSHPLQSWEWGEARKKMGIRVLRVGEYKGKSLEHSYQLTLHHIPHTEYRIAYLPRSRWPSSAVFEFLNAYARQNKIIFIKIEPDISAVNIEVKETEQLVKSKHPLFPEWTQVLDLTRTEDELLGNMHQKTRYNIRLAQKKGVVVKEMSDDKGFAIFSKLYFETCKRQHYFGHTPEYHRIIWETSRHGIAHILIAYYQNIPLAAYELFYFNKTFYYPYGGTSIENRNVMAANLLMWEAIRLGRALGAKKFDMWGSLAPQYDQNHDWAGFTRFKQGYGTRFVQFPGSYDLVTNAFLYRLYAVAYKLRSWYLNIRKLS